MGYLVERLALNLRDRRADTGLSQETLADRIGLHRTCYGHLETGRRNLTLNTFEGLATRLGLDDAADLLRE